MYEKKKNYTDSLNKTEFVNSGKTFSNNADVYFITQNEVEALCKKYEIPIVVNNILSEEDINKNEGLIFPLVAKGLNKDVVHKSELNAVKINIKNKDELNIAIDEIKKSFNKNKLDVESYLIQPFIKTKHELLIGGVRDNSFGPIVMFGSGGKYVEVFEDTEIRSAYLTEADIDEMIAQTKIGRILKGVRGEKETNIKYLKEIIESVSQMMIENDNILEIDLNPLIVDENNNYHAVDVRVKIKGRLSAYNK